MAKVDWEQVAKDYEASTLDMAWVTSYAQKAAKLLVDHHISPMGYTDEKQGEVDKRIAEANDGSGKVAKFFRNLFAAEPSDTPEKRYAREHIGYWVICKTETGDTTNEKLRNPCSGNMSKKSRQIYEYSLYCLLDTGELACFHYSSFQIWLGYSRQRYEVEGGWAPMSENLLLLLDRRVRYEDENNGYLTKNGSYYYRSYLSTDNYLITGKKGGGCRKLLGKLLEEHGIKDPRIQRRDRSRSKIGTHAISKTYTVTGEQLKNGFALTHAFANGSTYRVDVYPGSQSGKVIAVRNTTDDTTEWIRIVEGK